MGAARHVRQALKPGRNWMIVEPAAGDRTNNLLTCHKIKGLLMAEIEDIEQPYPRPLSGAKVRQLPSTLVPARTAFIGRNVTLEPLDAVRHAADLFEASHGSEAALRIWEYLPWGPWKSEAEYRNVLRQQTARPEQIYYAIHPAAGGKACGHTS